MKYPFVIKTAEDGSLRCEFPDIPEMETIRFDDHLDIAERAHEAFSKVLEVSYRRLGREIPAPSRVKKGEYYLYVHIGLQAKILLWHRLLKVNMSASELARRYGCSRQELQRVLDLSRNSGLDKVEQLLLKLDRSFSVDAVTLP